VLEHLRPDDPEPEQVGAGPSRIVVHESRDLELTRRADRLEQRGGVRACAEADDRDRLLRRGGHAPIIGR
jgi:hypothetical protein